jgi:hypothetical protein
MWANTPSFLAVRQANYLLGIPFPDMRLVTLGNGEVPTGAVAAEFTSTRSINPSMISYILDMMFSTQAHMADQTAEMLIGKQNVFPINAPLDRFIPLDDVSAALKKLPPLAEEAAAQTAEQLKTFLSATRSSDPKATLGEDVVRSLRKYGYLRLTKEETIRDQLSTSKYIRAQNLYELMQKGLLTVQRTFRCINDHPFKPFSDLVLEHLVPNARIILINACPDTYYSKTDVERRIQLIENKGADIQYYLLPKEDVHLSMLIYDERAVLVYPTPLNREVCTFSDGLLFTDSKAVAEWVGIFSYIEKMADHYQHANRINALSELKKFTDFYVA